MTNTNQNWEVEFDALYFACPVCKKDAPLDFPKLKDFIKKVEQAAYERGRGDTLHEAAKAIKEEAISLYTHGKIGDSLMVDSSCKNQWEAIKVALEVLKTKVNE